MHLLPYIQAADLKAAKKVFQQVLFRLHILQIPSKIKLHLSFKESIPCLTVWPSLMKSISFTRLIQVLEVILQCL